jgi:c-di-GMP-binding flagellar brake protein YcgR
MRERYESERREFVRINVDIPVRYKFLSREVDLQDDSIYQGHTSNLGGGGLLLIGKVPNPSWYVDLLTQKIVVGVNLLLPSSPEPVKALCRVAWLEAIEEGHKVAMGLKFKEITRNHQDEIYRAVIRAQLK